MLLQDLMMMLLSSYLRQSRHVVKWNKLFFLLLLSSLFLGTHFEGNQFARLRFWNLPRTIIFSQVFSQDLFLVSSSIQDVPSPLDVLLLPGRGGRRGGRGQGSGVCRHRRRRRHSGSDHQVEGGSSGGFCLKETFFLRKSSNRAET